MGSKVGYLPTPPKRQGAPLPMQCPHHGHVLNIPKPNALMLNHRSHRPPKRTLRLPQAQPYRLGLARPPFRPIGNGVGVGSGDMVLMYKLNKIPGKLFYL